MPAFRNPTYPTRDQVIPVALFEMLIHTTDAIETGEQLRAANAAALGAAMGGPDKAGKLKRFMRDMRRRAYPVVYGNLGETEDPTDG